MGNPTNRRLLPFTKTTGRGLEILPPVRGFKSGQFVGSNQHRPLPPRTKRLALKCFFKVDYLDSKSHKAWRPIAWCSFLTGKYDQARNYYKKILDNQPNAQDLLNAGHTEWALQNIKGALSFYQQAVQMENGNFLKFQEQFSQDVADLLIAGIEETEVALMLDQLRYNIEGSF